MIMSTFIEVKLVIYFDTELIWSPVKRKLGFFRFLYIEFYNNIFVLKKIQ